MTSNTLGFYAYTSSPTEIGQTIETAVTNTNYSIAGLTVHTWKALDIIGHFISEEVLEGIEETSPTIREVGIFDTLDYSSYQNSIELGATLKTAKKISPLKISSKVNIKSPVYLLEGLHKTDWATRIVSRIKKAGFLFRTFDPSEQPRLSASDAINHVSQSHGVVVPLLSKNKVGTDVHNIRGAFIAGLAEGMRKALGILQDGEEPVPLDYRDFVYPTFHTNDINEHIANFASHVAEAFQQGVEISSAGTTDTFLQSLDLSATSAENEMRTLENYYLKTDQFLKSLRGEANLVVGRKGSGKSAIFLQVRDRERNKQGNIVLGLKPDGYKLIKFKELILSYLKEGTFQHTIMAFWEYVLLLEICYKTLGADWENHKRDHVLFQPYRDLADLYRAESYDTEGNFSERMSSLIEKISREYNSKHGNKTNVRLSASQLTEMLYSHDVRELTKQVINYISHKDSCWLLFDNIDKGWPISGLKHEDLLIIRALIDATKKIYRQFNKSDVTINSIAFLRNDVFELLVEETSDRGEEANVLLDWTDPDLLRELVRLRIASNDVNGDNSFETLWREICVSHIDGEESFQYLIDRSLMRPRFLLNLISQCKSYAINLNHEKIQKEDIEKGLTAYSTDLLGDIGYEVNDIESEVEDILYAFIESGATMSRTRLDFILSEFGVDDQKLDNIFELLIWYGFIGVTISNEVKYIYDFNYSIKLITEYVKNKPERTLNKRLNIYLKNMGHKSQTILQISQNQTILRH